MSDSTGVNSAEGTLAGAPSPGINMTDALMAGGPAEGVLERQQFPDEPQAQPSSTPAREPDGSREPVAPPSLTQQATGEEGTPAAKTAEDNYAALKPGTPRFDEVIAERNALKARLEALAPVEPWNAAIEALKARGFTDPAAVIAAYEQQERATAETALKAELDAWEQAQAAQVGEYAAAEMRKIEERARRLEADQVTFKQTADQAQATIRAEAMRVEQGKFIDATLAEVRDMPAVHGPLRELLATTAPQHLPDISAKLLTLIRDAQNDAVAAYLQKTGGTGEQQPTPEGGGGGTRPLLDGRPQFDPRQGITMDLLAAYGQKLS